MGIRPGCGKMSTGAGRRSNCPYCVWDCVNNVCGTCGADTKTQLKTCKILSKSELVINVLEWISTPRQGM